MSGGATVWARSDELLIVGTVCLFLIPFAIIGLGMYISNAYRHLSCFVFIRKQNRFRCDSYCYIFVFLHKAVFIFPSFSFFVSSLSYIHIGSGEDDENLLVLFTLLAAVPVALFATLKMFVSVQKTDQVEPEAWGLVMFATCSVTVKTTYGLYVVMYVLAGTLVVVYYDALRHSTVQYSTVQYSSVQFSTVQYSTTDSFILLLHYISCKSENSLDSRNIRQPYFHSLPLVILLFFK